MLMSYSIIHVLTVMWITFWLTLLSLMLLFTDNCCKFIRLVDPPVSLTNEEEEEEEPSFI